MPSEKSLSEVRFTKVVGLPLVTPTGERTGKVTDCVVRLAEGSLPAWTGVVLSLGAADVFVSLADVQDVTDSALLLRTARVDVRPFERRPGEVLLRRDVLGRGVIDVSVPRLVRVTDVEMNYQDGEWHISGVVAARSGGLLARARGHHATEVIPWPQVEPLVGHGPTVGSSLRRLTHLKPADIADIVESSSHDEGKQLLQAVGHDEEFEADVFEELNERHQLEFLKERSDEEVAKTLSNMEPDAAADLLMRFGQSRRIPIFNLLPAEEQTAVRKLLGYGDETAGGLMSNEFVALPGSTTVGDAIDHVRKLPEIPRIFTDIFVVEDGKLTGSLTLAVLMRADIAQHLNELASDDPQAVYADADLPSVAVDMADYNLSTLPVISDSGELLGIVTYDDLVATIIPAEWRWRGKPDHAHVSTPRTAE